MDAQDCIEKLSRFQQDALVKIGKFGEGGMWTSGWGVNWISVALMLRKKATPALLEGVPDKHSHCRLTELGREVVAAIPAARQTKRERQTV